MNTVSFGDAQFSITARDLVVLKPRPALSQVKIVVAGEGWSLESAGADETLGVVSERLAQFASNSAARHWGSFVGVGTPSEAVGRVAKYGFGVPASSSTDYHRWEISSAFVNYSLSACFDNNLGVQQVIAVRSSRVETIIWQTVTGDVFVAEVPVPKFDYVLTTFVEWAAREGDGELRG